jgi:hypothetical protein
VHRVVESGSPVGHVLSDAAPLWASSARKRTDVRKWRWTTWQACSRCSIATLRYDEPLQKYDQRSLCPVTAGPAKVIFSRSYQHPALDRLWIAPDADTLPTSLKSGGVPDPILLQTWVVTMTS